MTTLFLADTSLPKIEAAACKSRSIFLTVSFLGVGIYFDFLCTPTFFSKPFNEKFKFLKSCRYDSYKI